MIKLKLKSSVVLECDLRSQMEDKQPFQFCFVPYSSANCNNSLVNRRFQTRGASFLERAVVVNEV